MKIVLDTIYHGEKEFRKIFNKQLEDDGTSDDGMNFDDIDGEDSGESLFDLDEAIEGDITMLGNEEMTRTVPPGADDDDPESKIAGGSTMQSKPEKKAIKGSTEDDAIVMLSDDDEDDQPSPPASASTQSVASSNDQVASSANGSALAKPKNGRCYNQIFDGPKFEMQLAAYKGRPIVSQRTTTAPTKPAVADILVAVNGTTLPLNPDLQQILIILKDLISKGPVELTFMESEGFTSHLLRNHRAPAPQRPPQPMPARSTQNQGPSEVIELSDDGD